MLAQTELEAFSLFQDLPGELRNKIWGHTLEPRRITLTCRTISSMTKRIDLPHPFAFTPPPRSPDYPVEQFAWLTSETPTPMALRVSRESRSYAKQWYVAWWIWKTVSNFRPMRFKVLMWDPTVDIIDFLDMNNNLLPIERFLPLFVKQFPLQATQVQRLAVSSSIWRSSDHDAVARIWSLIDCTNLQEFIVDIDEEYEKRVAESWKGIPLAHAKPWMLPRDIERQLLTLDAHYEKWAPDYCPKGWKPVVRVLRDKSGYFTTGKDSCLDKGVEVVLRCFPCLELGMMNDENTASGAHPAL